MAGWVRRAVSLAVVVVAWAETELAQPTAVAAVLELARTGALQVQLDNFSVGPAVETLRRILEDQTEVVVREPAAQARAEVASVVRTRRWEEA